eukprot:768264-Hanusia_phi.AAC.2
MEPRIPARATFPLALIPVHHSSPSYAPHAPAEPILRHRSAWRQTGNKHARRGQWTESKRTRKRRRYERIGGEVGGETGRGSDGRRNCRRGLRRVEEQYDGQEGKRSQER